MLATRIRETGSFSGTRSAPDAWNITRLGSNPVITVSPGNPSETHEQYTPGPIQLANGDRWVYVKGLASIYAWKASAGSTVYTLQNGGSPVLSPVAATWEANFVLEPCMVYDEPSGTIHMFYKGRDSNPVNWQWGHATASDSNPTSFSRDAGNPIFTKANAQTDLGGGTTTDFAVSDVVLIGSTYHFYGYGQYNSGSGSIYRLLHATGSAINNPSGLSILTSAADVNGVVEEPTVFVMPGPGPLLYGMFYSRGVASTLATSIRLATSSDGSTWDFSDTTDVMAPTSGWEANQVFACSLLKQTRAPYLRPIVDENGWTLYYSGIGASTNANAGIAYLEPSYT